MKLAVIQALLPHPERTRGIRSLAERKGCEPFGVRLRVVDKLQSTLSVDA